ncbi:hypothetical protein [Yersinia bercovieri]|uniref:hypothetical protein n=1 Tax=Yersinia bercovieri TaxID=634 RepID=UPI0011AB7F6D|nr:hypothetical protein [Yersinia bercovieri]
MSNTSEGQPIATTIIPAVLPTLTREEVITKVLLSLLELDKLTTPGQRELIAQELTVPDAIGQTVSLVFANCVLQATDKRNNINKALQSSDTEQYQIMQTAWRCLQIAQPLEVPIRRAVDNLLLEISRGTNRYPDTTKVVSRSTDTIAKSYSQYVNTTEYKVFFETSAECCITNFLSCLNEVSRW